MHSVDSILLFMINASAVLFMNDDERWKSLIWLWRIPFFRFVFLIMFLFCSCLEFYTFLVIKTAKIKIGQ